MTLRAVLLSAELFCHQGKTESPPSAFCRALESSQLSFEELRSMSPSQRVALLKSYGLPSQLLPRYVRALQHCLTWPTESRLPDHPQAFPRFNPNNWYPSFLPTVVPQYTSKAQNAHLAVDELGAVSTSPVTNASMSIGTRREDCGFVGLLNQGCTCYLNSLLQALFHIVPFRENIYLMPTTNDSQAATAAESPNSTAASLGSADSPGRQPSHVIPLALQKLFYQLETNRSPCSTTILTDAFGWTANDSFTQHDVHELTRILLDNIEEKLKAAKKPNFIAALFHGEQRNYFKVPDVDYESGSNEGFYDLGLVVKGCADIYDSLDMYFAKEELTGGNKYCVEREGQKSYHDAIRGVELRSLPPVLLIHLNRFDFDPVTGESTKVLSRWQYYDELDVSKYSPEGTASLGGIYELHSVMVHSGADARFGHYYCFVKVDVEMWLKFNDETVEKVELFDVFGANFGGTTLGYWGSPITQSSNAYMLVYRRRDDQALFASRQLCIPQELKDRVAQDQAEAEQARRARLEEHSFLNIKIVTVGHIRSLPVLLVNPYVRPTAFTRLRLRRDHPDEHLQEVCEAELHISPARLTIWTSECAPTGWHRMGQRVQNLSLSLYPAAASYTGRSPLCYFVADSGDVPIDCSSMVLTHHKLYDSREPLVDFVGPVVLSDKSTSVGALKLKFLALCNACLATTGADAPSDVLRRMIERFVERHAASGTRLHTEEGDRTIALINTDTLCIPDGTIFVWEATEASDSLVPDATTRPSCADFYHRIKHKCEVTVRWNDERKGHPIAVTKLLLVDDNRYGELQQLVAAALNHPEDAPFLRFVKQGPHGGPLQRLQKKHTSVADLIDVAGSRVDCVYVEKLSFTVEEAEQQKLLSFDFFNDNVKFVSRHTVILPRDPKTTLGQVFSVCRSAAGLPDDGKKVRLLDVFHSKFYSVFEDESALSPPSFDETFSFRLEYCPLLLTSMPSTEQLLVNCVHGSRSTTQSVSWQLHSEPFSILIHKRMSEVDFRAAITTKLQLPDDGTKFWKLWIAGETADSPPYAVEDDIFSKAKQVARACSGKVTIYLEHSAPPTSGSARRPERALRIYN